MFNLLLRQLHHSLVGCVHGSMQAYLAVTAKSKDDEKVAAWEQYNAEFDRVVATVIEFCDKHEIGLAEKCHLAIKLLEKFGGEVDKVEGENPDEPVKAWFVPLAKH